jgi:hypothetical protein
VSKKQAKAIREAAEAKKLEDSEASLKDALEALTPEQADMFLRALELTMRKRRMMLLGYLAAAFAMVLGTVWSLYMYGTHEPGTFIGWVFLIPFAVAGSCLYIFGKLSRRVGMKLKGDATGSDTDQAAAQAAAEATAEAAEAADK